MEIFYAGCYTRQEKVLQHLTGSMLCLIVSGFEYMKFYSEDKRLLTPPVEIDGKNPFLMLIPPGITLDFSASAGRENWVAMLNLPEIRCERGSIQCSLNGHPLSAVIKLTAERVCVLREIFAEIVEGFYCAQPAAAEKAKLRLHYLLAELVSVPAVNAERSPAAAALKKAIDTDSRFRYSITELNRDLGYCSLPYMRKLFLEEYGILPGKYRSIKRMNRIMELFAQSGFSLKMIADEVGMKHLSHLYAFLRSEQPLPPKKLLEQIRGKVEKP